MADCFAGVVVILLCLLVTTKASCADDEGKHFSCSDYQMKFNLCEARHGTLYDIAIKRCPKFCGFCDIKALCVDVQDVIINCAHLSSKYNICKATSGSSYELALKRCPKFCGLCGETTPFTTSTQLPVSSRIPTTPDFTHASYQTCTDVEDQHFSCSNYEAQYNLCRTMHGTLYIIAIRRCRKYCGLCGETILATTTTEDTVSSTTPTPFLIQSFSRKIATTKYIECMDHDSRCILFRQQICSPSVSRPYVISTCARTCNLCAEYLGETTLVTTTTQLPISSTTLTTSSLTQSSTREAALVATTTQRPESSTSTSLTQSLSQLHRTDAIPHTDVQLVVPTDYHTTVSRMTLGICRDLPGVDCLILNSTNICASPFSHHYCAAFCGHCKSDAVQTVFG